MVEEVLQLGKAESGHLAVQRAPVNLVVLARRLVRGVDTEADGLPATVPLDERLPVHIFNNLLSNAFKHSPGHCTVWLRFAGEAELLSIKVRDEGIGIPAADRAKLFQTFQRDSDVGDIAGTGLGLVIVKRCVELHGEYVDFTSRVKHGTGFVVTLPLVPPDSPASVSP